MNKSLPLHDWSPEQIARAKKWIDTWKLESADLERISRKKLRNLDIYEAISRLWKSADHTLPPPKPWSGLVELQQWFKLAAERERNR
jgi:hypothetical protein